MPYNRVDKCVYKKKRDGSQGEKKGCSKTVAMAKKYLNWEAKRDLKQMCYDSWIWKTHNFNGYFN